MLFKHTLITLKKVYQRPESKTLIYNNNTFASIIVTWKNINYMPRTNIIIWSSAYFQIFATADSLSQKLDYLRCGLNGIAPLKRQI